jgi:arylformamidase
MSRPIDISLTVGPDLLVWPSDPAVEVERRRSISAGDDANVSELRIGTHTGTHVDPPVHFVEGAGGIDQVPVDVLVGPALVADLRGRPGPLSAADVEEAVPPGTERLLLLTDNSMLWRRLPVAFPDRYTCLSPDAAAWLIEHGVRLVGTDFLSIEERGAEGHPVHRSLLESGVVIVEGIDLGEVDPGPYQLVCLPLKILDGDGGPARAVLIPP